VGVLAAAVGALLASGAISRLINGVVLPSRNLLARTSSRGFAFRVRGPLSAYVLKDLRVSSRNPATGFLFALPLFEILAVVLPVTATTVVSMSSLVVGAQVGGGFALFTAFLLVTVEDFGVERKTALPFSERVRTISKAAVSTVTYVPVTVALVVVLLVKPSVFSGAIIVPFASIGSVFAASVFEVVVLKLLAERNSGSAARFIAGIGSGEAVMLVPALAYAALYFSSRSHWASIELMTAISAVELLAAVTILRFLGTTGKAPVLP
jgi:predicted permease